LRNRIYRFAAISEGPVHISRKCDVTAGSYHNRPKNEDSLPRSHAGLRRVCRQVRKEYLKIQRSQSRIVVDWFAFPAFLDTFFGSEPLRECSLWQLRISLAPLRPRTLPKPHVIEILPLLEMRAQDPTLNYEFVDDASRVIGGYLRASKDLNHLLHIHRTSSQLANVSRYTLSSVKISHPGERFNNLYITFKADKLASQDNYLTQADWNRKVFEAYGFEHGRKFGPFGYYTCSIEVA